MNSSTPQTGAIDSPYPVIGFRGSYLELMIALERYGSGLHADHVLVHLPGLNKESVSETPVFELYKAGEVYERNLTTLVREAAVGVATPTRSTRSFARPDLTLAKATAGSATSARSRATRSRCSSKVSASTVNGWLSILRVMKAA